MTGAGRSIASPRDVRVASISMMFVVFSISGTCLIIDMESPSTMLLFVLFVVAAAVRLYIYCFFSLASIAIFNACFVNSFSFFTLMYSIGEEKHSLSFAE